MPRAGERGEHSEERSRGRDASDERCRVLDRAVRLVATAGACRRGARGARRNDPAWRAPDRFEGGRFTSAHGSQPGRALVRRRVYLRKHETLPRRWPPGLAVQELPQRPPRPTEPGPARRNGSSVHRGDLRRRLGALHEPLAPGFRRRRSCAAPRRAGARPPPGGQPARPISGARRLRGAPPCRAVGDVPSLRSEWRRAWRQAGTGSRLERQHIT